MSNTPNAIFVDEYLNHDAILSFGIRPQEVGESIRKTYEFKRVRNDDF